MPEKHIELHGNPDLDAEAKAWTEAHAYGVPSEITAIADGKQCIVRENWNPVFRKRTIKVHPVTYNGNVGKVSPDGPGSEGAVFLPPGVYTVEYGKTLGVSFWSASNTQMRSVGYVNGWVVLRMDLAEHQGKVGQVSSYAFFAGGQKPLDQAYLQVDTWPRPKEKLPPRDS
jgi:hypothetical protein